MTMKLIQTVTLTSTQSTIVLSSIPQTFTDLMILTSLRTTGTGVAVNDIGLTSNASDSWRRLEGNGSTMYSDNGTAYTQGGATTTSVSAANTFGNSMAYIPNYTSTQVKTVLADGVTENTVATAHQRITISLINSTSPITSLTIGSGAGNDYVAGSTISLYGITSGSDGVTTVAFA